MLKNAIKDLSDFIRTKFILLHVITQLFYIHFMYFFYNYYFFFVMSENFEAFISHSVYKRNNLQHYIHVQLGK